MASLFKRRRARLTNALRGRIAERLRNMGFRNPRSEHFVSIGAAREDTWVRWRGSTREEIEFEWCKGPWFYANFRVRRQPQRGPAQNPAAYQLEMGVLVARDWQALARLDSYAFGWLMTTGATVRLLEVRLAQLDSYFLYDNGDRHIDIWRRTSDFTPPSPLEDGPMLEWYFFERAIPPEALEP